MVRISEALVRKRAEHNEGEIFSLEELSLHQQDIEKIENLDKWCRELRILYLQNNLIGKIENVSRLKKLEYLNLALNNVEVIENLENCESLKKLDLTVNFVGILTSVENLKDLIHFEELYLTGNPCTNFEGYRDFVIATLPNLKTLDGEDISRSERIKAEQNYRSLREKIEKEQKNWLLKRKEEKEEAEKRKEQRELSNGDNEEFWKEQIPYSPEARWETHQYMEEQKKKEKKDEIKEEKAPRAMFNKDGKPYNINEGKIEFKLIDEDDDNCIKLDVSIYKHLDTSLVDCDVQPNYVRVTIKGKILQLALPYEVRSDESTAQRSQTTGHLIVTMPKLHGIIKPMKKDSNKNKETTKYEQVTNEKSSTKTTFNNEDKRNDTIMSTNKKEVVSKQTFIDDPSVPPLE